jgi:hypothetical protein
MNPNKRQSATIGIFLIGLGLVMWLHLWWLVWPGALVIAGGLAYRERRRIGRPAEAVQAALWCIGMALVFLSHFWLGMLFLAGLSVLLRGRELMVDAVVQGLVGQARGQRATLRPITTQQVPITTQPAQATPPSTEYEAATTGQTTRLPE